MDLLRSVQYGSSQISILYIVLSYIEKNRKIYIFYWINTVKFICNINSGKKRLKAAEKKMPFIYYVARCVLLHVNFFVACFADCNVITTNSLIFWNHHILDICEQKKSECAFVFYVNMKTALCYIWITLGKERNVFQ